MIVKDKYGITVNTDHIYELQVSLVKKHKVGFIARIFGFKEKESKYWQHWKYYKTMGGVLAALKDHKNRAANTKGNCQYNWHYRPAHKYYN